MIHPSDPVVCTMSFGDLKPNEIKDLQRRNEERLSRVSNSMSQTQKQLQETEDIGMTIIDEMQQQHEQLVSTRDNVRETQSFSMLSQSVIKGMRNRAWRKRCCLNSIIAGLVCAILTVLWYGYLKPLPS